MWKQNKGLLDCAPDKLKFRGHLNLSFNHGLPERTRHQAGRQEE
jgi:hypothetical protein